MIPYILMAAGGAIMLGVAAVLGLWAVQAARWAVRR